MTMRSIGFENYPLSLEWSNYIIFRVMVINLPADQKKKVFLKLFVQIILAIDYIFCLSVVLL